MEEMHGPLKGFTEAPLGGSGVNPRPIRIAAAAPSGRCLPGADGSCRPAIGAVSRLEGDRLTLKGEILSPDGQTEISGELSGPASAPEALGHELGQILRDKAGSEFLKLFPA